MAVTGQPKVPARGKDKDKNKQQEKAAALPDFPALGCCVLVDARYSSRLDIIKDLKASLLFEEILEAKSLSDAEVLLNRHRPDACFIGPSVTPDRAIEFITEGKKKDGLGDCAFIALINADSAVRENLLNNGAHRVIERPYSKYLFVKEVIGAIITANAGHPWKALAVSLGLIQDDDLSTPAINPLLASAHPADNADGRTSPDVNKLLSALNFSELASTGGAPSLETIEKIKGLINSLLPERADDASLQELRLFLEGEIHHWITDQQVVSREMATKNLKRKIGLFLQNKQ